MDDEELEAFLNCVSGRVLAGHAGKESRRRAVSAYFELWCCLGPHAVDADFYRLYLATVVELSRCYEELLATDLAVAHVEEVIAAVNASLDTLGQTFLAAAESDDGPSEQELVTSAARRALAVWIDWENTLGLQAFLYLETREIVSRNLLKQERRRLRDAAEHCLKELQ